MGLTLEELGLILEVLIYYDPVRKIEAEEAIRLIKREIKLKTMNPITGIDYEPNKSGR